MYSNFFVSYPYFSLQSNFKSRTSPEISSQELAHTALVAHDTPKFAAPSNAIQSHDASLSISKGKVGYWQDTEFWEVSNFARSQGLYTDWDT